VSVQPRQGAANGKVGARKRGWSAAGTDGVVGWGRGWIDAGSHSTARPDCTAGEPSLRGALEPHEVRDAGLDDAYSAVVVHVAGPDGWCVGCADLGRFALAPCQVGRNALVMLETHGVAVWDARPIVSVVGECGCASLTPFEGPGASSPLRAAV
jgi:hypothetical protein